MEMKPELVQRLDALEKKFTAMGQDILSYLDGLLYADYLTYWDYIHVDTLLSLQNPKTSFPDEEIFIMYHQITELYFKLCLHEYDQLAAASPLDGKYFLSRVNRINSYFENLVRSFDIMITGMDPDQFLKFRMSLLPASGFQSAQYRMIEICSTDFIHLVEKNSRAEFENKNASIPQMFEKIYWKAGATELATGKKTLTLQQFEEKYSKNLIELARKYNSCNLWQLYKMLPEADQSNPQIINTLKMLDTNVNVNWPLSHYKSAVRYLQKDPEDIKATGGTNWQKYLPPRFQKRVFYPALWNAEEMENWGKGWVAREVFGM
ncbi:MAG: tryptophan 2,3-dioxygenase [Bacteroidetes bacterium]|nr:tryptophan 2,3-dioxygenase [Bacteroidota bacterium]MBP6401180.1 tryptophan 2,3-dioxygenase [Bacteroidia bacterium]MBP6649634.1 tryptophan 2,3-dioxygenase [Bacteroidia bacterium]